MPHDFQTKCHLVRVSVFPAALYGSTVRPPSSDALDSLCFATSQAILGHCPSVSASVALLSLPCGVLDPEFWVFCQVIRAARCFLLQASAPVRSLFLKIAARFVGVLHTVRGPASTFGFCIRQLGWSLNADGHIMVNAFLGFNICACSFQRLRRLMVLSWQEKFVLHFTHRKSWFPYPDISSVSTAAVLRRFPPYQQRLLVRENSGGYQSFVQKVKWLKGESGCCPFCPELDTRAHRLLSCRVGNDVRDKYQDLINWIESSGSEIPEFPYVTVHPSLEALHFGLYSLDIPCFDHVVM